MKKGDILESPEYNSMLHVVEIFDKSFRFFNRVTGELSNEINNSNSYEIKELKVVEKESSDVVIATKFEEDTI